MYKQYVRRPVLLSSLNICFIDKPSEEGLDGFSYGRYGGGIYVISGLVPLLLRKTGAFDSLHWGE